MFVSAIKSLTGPGRVAEAVCDVKVSFLGLLIHAGNARADERWRLNNIGERYIFSGIFITNPDQKIIRKNLWVFTKKIWKGYKNNFGRGWPERVRSLSTSQL